VLHATSALAEVPAALPAEVQVDAPVPSGTAARLLEATAGFLKDSYVFPEQVPALEKKLRHLAKTKTYADSTAATLVEAITKDIQEASHDRHLRIVYSHDPLPATGQPPLPEPPDAERARDAAGNFGFQNAQILDGNLGYLDIRFLPYAAEAGETVVAAMAFLANTRALIIDLRHNHGGDPATVALILSYFFGNEPVHLNDLYWRPDNSTGQYWTQPFVPGRKYTGDIYVLAGPGTFSAGEEFAYDLQTQKRATIVGEPTGGGAHPITLHRIDDHFMALVPSGRAINPITHADWEGTGVKPDVAVPADQALDKAKALAVAKVEKH
jgi:retinol-binding protein 3